MNAKRLGLAGAALLALVVAASGALWRGGDSDPLRVVAGESGESGESADPQRRPDDQESCPDPPLRATWLPQGYGPELRRANHEPWGEGRFWETAEGRHWIRLDNETNTVIYGNLQNPSAAEPMTVLGAPASIGPANSGLSVEFRACAQAWTLTAGMEVSKFAPNHPLDIDDLRRMAEGLDPVGGWTPVPGPVLSVRPGSGPPGSTVRVNGVGFADRASKDPADLASHPLIFLVRRDADDRRWAGPLGWNFVTRGGSLHGGGAIPGEVTGPGAGPEGSTDRMPTAPGTYQLAVGDPDNVVPGTAFEVIAPQIGVGYPNAAYFYSCDVFATSFDSSYWLADPPLGSSRGGYPGTFTMTEPDRGELVVSDTMAPFVFRRLPPDEPKPGAGCW